MHQLTGIALCVLLFVCAAICVTGEDEDLPSVTMEVLSSGDNMTSDDISAGHTNNTTQTNLTTMSQQTGHEHSTETGNPEDVNLDWLNDAIRDVAYYLRAYKFNEYDRRYEKEQPNITGFFGGFPRPPLRSLHFEVQNHCELSFLDCIKYLHKRIKLAAHQRISDTSVVVNEQNWFDESFKDQIDSVDEDCQNMLEKELKFMRSFEGPLERFQWRTTASYYLCWYTTNEVKYLENIGERCDNFANCLDPVYGANNDDARASDNDSFHCMLYSVCPDPCCPLRHITDYADCWNNDVNPCFQDNVIGHRRCSFQRNRNTDFRDIVLNHWNVTCTCAKRGYAWNSRFGTCVDVNECAIGDHNCDLDSQVCVNLPGSFLCLCNWGYIWNDELKQCTSSPALDLIKRQRQPVQQSNQTKSLSIVRVVQQFISKLKNDSERISNVSTSIFICNFLSYFVFYH